MTHPLVSAFHRLKNIEAAQNKNLLEVQRGLLQNQAIKLLRHISEVMASIPQVKFSVGFFNGYNNKVFFVWLWPLKPAWNVPDQHYQYFVYDAEWVYRDGYERYHFSSHSKPTW